MEPAGVGKSGSLSELREGVPASLADMISKRLSVLRHQQHQMSTICAPSPVLHCIETQFVRPRRVREARRNIQSFELLQIIFLVCDSDSVSDRLTFRKDAFIAAHAEGILLQPHTQEMPSPHISVSRSEHGPSAEHVQHVTEQLRDRDALIVSLIVRLTPPPSICHCTMLGTLTLKPTNSN